MADTDLLDYAGLKSYDSKIKTFMHNRQMTKAAPNVQFCPAPESELEPIVDFLFTETPPASGDKSPSNPSTIDGVSSVKMTRCGKNLGRTLSTTTINYVTVTNNGDGTYTVNGTASADTYFTFTSSSVFCKLGEKYTISGISGGSSSTYRLTLQCYTKQGSFANGTFIFSGSDTLICESDGYLNSSLFVKSGTTENNLLIKPQIELGETATSFEAPDYSDYTIQLGDTYYGCSVNFKTGEMTVTWSGIIYTGEENIYTAEGADGYYQYGLPAPSYSAHFLACSCTHLITGGTTGDRFYVRATGGTGVRIYVSEYATADDVKAWLASQYANGTPVTVVYELATPFTVQLTPTQVLSLAQSDKYVPQINTVYSDQQAVRVGWQRIDIDSILARLDAIEAQLDG